MDRIDRAVLISHEFTHYTRYYETEKRTGNKFVLFSDFWLLNSLTSNFCLLSSEFLPEVIMPLFNWTGNPWVDAGIAAIIELAEKKYPEEIENTDINKCKNLIQSLYLNKAWQGNLYSVFPNHPITQSFGIKTRNIQAEQISSNFKRLSEKQSEGFKKLLEIMVNNITPLDESGNCIACGRRNTKEQRNKMHIPLTGYEGSHFFSFKTEGADYCDTCAFAVQCFPLLCYACGKLVLLHSNSRKVMRYWARRCISDVHKQIATRNFTGCLNEKYTNPTNALFHIAQDLILTYDERWTDENATLRIYHFTNYNQGPELDIYDLPSSVFRFLAYIRPHPKYRDWLKVIRKGYRNAEGKTEDEYRNYKNSVYLALLNGRSIIGYFVTIGTRTAIGDWSLLKFYLKEVLNMNDERIKTIKELANKLTEFIKQSSNPSRIVGEIERAQNLWRFSQILLRIERDRIRRKIPSPLITVDDYVDRLFPDGGKGFNEIHYILLFALYENLHDMFVSTGEAPEESEEAEIISDTLVE